ncbi:MAG: rhomboid family intramembrane serine protease [Candidatus Sericytochromatia bacterium]
MIPLHDENPRHLTPFVTWALIAANVLVFIYQLTLGEQGLTQFYYAYAVVPSEMTGDLGALVAGNPAPAQDYLPLLTSMFMHGGFMHLIGNMLFLHVFGDNIEDRLGHGAYLTFYLLGGLAASLAHAYSAPASQIPSLGASGAIGAVLGAYIVLHPTARITTLAVLGFFITTFRLPAIVYLGIWFVLQAFSGLASLGSTTAAESGGVAWWAHIGGFLFGVLVGLIAKAFVPERKPPRSRYADRWYSNR